MNFNAYNIHSQKKLAHWTVDMTTQIYECCLNQEMYMHLCFLAPQV